MSAVVDLLVVLLVGWYGLGLAAALALLWLPRSAPRRDGADIGDRRAEGIGRASV